MEPTRSQKASMLLQLLMGEILKRVVKVDRDFLTGLYNHPTFDRTLRETINRFQAENGHFLLLLLDVKDLKRLNNTHGHEKGDEVLKGVAEAIQAEMRAEDVAARFGGDEFVCLLPGTEVAYANELAETIGRRVVDLPERLGLVNGPLFLTHRVVGYPANGRTAEELIQKLRGGV